MKNRTDHFMYYARRLYRKNRETRSTWGESTLEFEEYLQANIDFIELGYSEYLKNSSESEES